MISDKSILAIITARGGSKGIPRKNITPLLGKPLIAWTIEAAKKSKYIDRLILSTEDQKIAKIGKDYGVEIPFLRPKDLATDEAKSVDCMIHAIKWLKNNDKYISDYVMLLQPTSPLRTVDDIDTALEEIFKQKGDSLIGLCKVRKHPYWMMKIERGIITPYYKKWVNYQRRQDLPDIYNVNGAIYIIKSTLLLKKKVFWSGKTIPYVMPEERSVDIDNKIDLKLADLLIQCK